MNDLTIRTARDTPAGFAAMKGSKLNAQVTIKNPGLQNMSLLNMHERPLPPTGARRRMDSELTLA